MEESTEVYAINEIPTSYWFGVVPNSRNCKFAGEQIPSYTGQTLEHIEFVAMYELVISLAMLAFSVQTKG